MCRKLLFYLEHIHLEGPGLKGVAGGNQKQNIPYVLSFFLLTDTPVTPFTESVLSMIYCIHYIPVFLLGVPFYIIILQQGLYAPLLMLLYFVFCSKLSLISLEMN
jgi:hypothetical protein